MSEPLVIVGCGGHGREVYGVVHAINEAYGEPWKVLGFVDDAPSDVNLGRLSLLGAPFLGALAELAGMGDEVRYVIGIGDPRVRAKVAAKIGRARTAAAPLIHPDASVGLGNEFGNGVVLLAGARVTTNVTLGRHVHVNQNATVGHDSVLDDFVQVNPLAAVSGDCRLGERALVGTTAAILQGLSVGAGATVGAGACVVRPVPSDTIVKGVPAR
ncbi:NeuD/PglB/VioB family sugar acetyltransferase [Actinoplanes sp. NPDC049681]|uniref:NeuD/PglB/VioB family sugar acetyltransferase n=1 Tax=Actinoplanes sp. NPDC049681 TaxID=3363905 RepID=UPI00378D7F7F